MKNKPTKEHNHKIVSGKGKLNKLSSSNGNMGIIINLKNK